MCLIFAPGDRYILAGTKEGKLLIVDIATSEIKEEIDAHNDEIWSICLTSDMVSKRKGTKMMTYFFLVSTLDKNALSTETFYLPIIICDNLVSLIFFFSGELLLVAAIKLLSSGSLI